MAIAFKTASPIYGPGDIIRVLDMSVDDTMLVSTGKRDEETKQVIKLYNLPAAFDIETTSFYVDQDLKQAIMYEWTFGINGNVIIGRTWDELEVMLNQMIDHLHLSISKRLVIYVHNLGFEFQFMRKRFDWNKVFSVETRKPVYAISQTGLEFRCSFLLSGYSLAKLGDELQKYPVQKMSGDLNYELLRHAETPLTEKELKYCENDVRVVMAYVQERIEIDKGIHKIPITKTGYVRQYCRNACLYTGKSHKVGVGKFKTYRSLMESLTLDVKEYKQLKRAFQGGFTHANAVYSETVQEQVASFDFTSSYPYVMVAEMFPMSKGELVNKTGQLFSVDEFEGYLKHFCCLFDIRIEGLMTTINFENYLSESKCWDVQNAVVNNGRIVCADSLVTTLTEQDFFIIKRTYTWDKITIANFRYYMKSYLPTDFINSILKLYEDKTTLKGVKGKEIEYLAGKGMLNATYGMTVTDICRDDNIYTTDHEWKQQPADFEEAIEGYNKGVKRFLFYPWGVWVTAYARRNLWTGILEFKNDYVYSDTDSVKVLNYEKHMDYINEYNEGCRVKLARACAFHGIPIEKVEPCTIKGVKKPLGVWDFEGVYDRFKTLGAKRYLTEKGGKIELTVSGVNKSVAVPYLVRTYGEDIFEAFDNLLYIPAEYTGKNTHTYIDEEMEGTIVDYMGQVLDYHELSGTHLEKADYSLSMALAYIDYIRGVRHVER